MNESTDEARVRMQADADDARHGTENGYGYWRCRCGLCREAHNTHMRAMRAQARARNMPTASHGTNTGYVYWGCRCDLCRAAHAKAERSRSNRARTGMR